MRLKRLQLQGYKTFATRTEFVFDEGVTAIVGPNGSGKSNVADAVRWVLGEQSYRMLRGSQTTDMIFAGSKARPRAGMAQAILTLDNSGGWLPIDFAEVEIGRRAYRSGENEYLLNGQKVRLRDITELLATSGLAERTYTMIGQGLVDRALSIKSDERRALFEEAAGISHYKVRRAESLRRLRDTQRNLERVGDILAEIRPRLNSLKRQANRARNYEQVAADLRQLLRIWYGYQWENSRQRYQQLRAESHIAEQKWSAGRDQLLILQETVSQQRALVREVDEKLRVLGEARDSTREKLELATRQVAFLNEREQMVSKQLAELAVEIPGLSAQKLASSQDLAVSLESLGSAQATVVDAEYKLRAFNDDSAEQRKQLAHWRQEVGRLSEAERHEQGQINQLEGRLVQLQERQREDLERVEPEESGGIAAAELAALEEAASAAQAALKQIRQDRQAERDTVSKLQKELGKKQQQGRELNNRLNKQAKELARLEARAEMLAERRQAALAVPDGVPIAGRLAEGLTIPAAYRTAVEAVLGVRLSTLLLDSEATLWSLLAQTPENSALSALLPDRLPELVQLEPPAATLGRASELVEATAALQAVVDYLLANVFVVAEEKDAYQIGLALPAGALAVSQSGLIVQAGGLVIREPLNSADSPLAREEAYRSAARAVESARKELSSRQEAVANQQSELQALQNEIDGFQPRERVANQAEQQANQALNETQRQLDRQRQQQAYIERQRRLRAEETARLEKRISDTEAQIEALREKLGEHSRALAAARQALDALPGAEMAQEQRNWQQQIDAAQTIVAGRQAVVDSRRAALNQIESQLQRLENQQAELQKQQRDIDLKVARDNQQKLQAESDRLQEQIAPLRTRRQELQQNLQEIEGSVVEQQRQTHNLETAFTRAQVAAGQHENLIEGLRERIKADVGLVALTSTDEDQAEQSPLPLEGIVEQLPSVSELPDDIERNIQDYRAQMQRMGAINPDAPTEFAETEERFQFLTEQVEDLTITEKQLRDVIAELDELTSRAFAETVHRVNQIFGGTFSQLFGGGTAELILTEPDDLTVSGVDIVAQLPRRRQQGLGLLSGGERSLTAAALIFSLLKVSPTPFCVMDEVDAMLDEANVNRFRDLLRELSLQTQFIVITHNRGTVQAAQTVYGISMGGDSVSQVISIKPEEYINAQELL